MRRRRRPGLWAGYAPARPPPQFIRRPKNVPPTPTPTHTHTHTHTHAHTHTKRKERNKKANKILHIKGSMQIERNKCNILELILLNEVIKNLIFSNRIPLVNKPESSLMLSV